MKDKVVLVDIDKLKIHEAVDKKKVEGLERQIKKDGFLKNPVVADKKTLVVLDGHHRLAALKKMGAKKIPVFLVDYKSNKVRVYLRRKKLMIKIIKEKVIEMGLSNRVFPFKTTRHLLSFRPRNINIKIKKLF